MSQFGGLFQDECVVTWWINLTLLTHYTGNGPDWSCKAPCWASSSPWQPLLVFNKLIYIKESPRMLLTFSLYFGAHQIRDGTSPANPPSLLTGLSPLNSTRLQTQMDTCTNIHRDCIGSSCHSSGVTAGWCTSSLFWISPANKGAASVEYTNSFVSLNPTIVHSGVSRSTVYHDNELRVTHASSTSFSHSSSSANRLMNKPIKSDFSIAFHLNCIASSQWYSIGNATHNRSSAISCSNTVFCCSPLPILKVWPLTGKSAPWFTAGGIIRFYKAVNRLLLGLDIKWGHARTTHTDTATHTVITLEMGGCQNRI